jgi:hypothetical protein
MGQDDPVTEPAVRPWGAYTVLAEGDGFKVKTIEVRLEDDHGRLPGEQRA